MNWQAQRIMLYPFGIVDKKAVSQVCQTIEALFHWIQDSAGIETTRKVCSHRGLLVHVFGRLAAAMLRLKGLL